MGDKWRDGSSVVRSIKELARASRHFQLAGMGPRQIRALYIGLTTEALAQMQTDERITGFRRIEPGLDPSIPGAHFQVLTLGGLAIPFRVTSTGSKALASHHRFPDIPTVRTVTRGGRIKTPEEIIDSIEQVIARKSGGPSL